MYPDLPLKSQKYLKKLIDNHTKSGYTLEQAKRLVDPTAAYLSKVIDEWKEQGLTDEEIDERLMG